MARNISSKAIAYLSKREGGMKLKVYDDGYGYPTVGVGHLVSDEDNLEVGDRISRSRAVAFLHEDLEWACEAVERFVRINLLQQQFDALVIFCFNIGQNAFRRSTLVRKLNRGDNPDTAVIQEMPRWNKVRGTFIRGLYNRRIDTAEMFIDGDYDVDWSGLEGQIPRR